MRDEDVPAWWGALGLPGLVDMHVHFLPERLMAAVWRFFDEARERYGVSWPVTYRTSDAERIATLRALGVRIYPALVYPHEPGMAESLNAWARQFAADTPGCVASGTFYPEPSVDQYVRAALEAGTRIFKVHVQVGEFDRPTAGWTGYGDCSPTRPRQRWCTVAMDRSPVAIPGRSLCRLCCAAIRS